METQILPYHGQWKYDGGLRHPSLLLQQYNIISLSLTARLPHLTNTSVGFKTEPDNTMKQPVCILYTVMHAFLSVGCSGRFVVTTPRFRVCARRQSVLFSLRNRFAQPSSQTRGDSVFVWRVIGRLCGSFAVSIGQWVVLPVSVL